MAGSGGSAAAAAAGPGAGGKHDDGRAVLADWGLLAVHVGQGVQEALGQLQLDWLRS